MVEKTRNFGRETSLKLTPGWGSWLLRLVLALWILQLVWLAWLVREEIVDVPRRLWSHSWGQTVRREDPFYRWLGQVDRIITPQTTYIFLDNYEAGKEIEARYHLFPRQHLLIRPQVPPSLLFHIIGHERPAYLLIRDPKLPLGSGLKAALEIDAAEPLPLPGPGLVLRVNPDRIAGGFYD